VVDDSTDARILAHLARAGHARSGEIAAALGLSRQAIHRRLRRLLDAGRVIRSGAGRSTSYRLAPGSPLQVRYSTAGLAEDRVWSELAAREPLAHLSDRATDVFNYAMTELVNNAIDHSGAAEVEVGVMASPGGEIVMEVVDRGAGVFAHVRDHFGLPDELAALQQLSKGKTTTAPAQHTGEGLFFVSKAADYFRLESGELAWLVDNKRGDVGVEGIERPRRGTLARFEADPDHPVDLAAVFDEYTSDHEFSRTRTVIKLFTVGVRFISRSEAKRLVLGLEKFREVILDFKGVEAVGQGFCDQVFRVWAREHPEVSLVPVAMIAPVAAMVERARQAR
jgi:DNA-binding Lrp family transcriptional regulator